MATKTPGVTFTYHKRATELTGLNVDVGTAPEPVAVSPFSRLSQYAQRTLVARVASRQRHALCLFPA